ncbi:transcriptional regulator opi1 [Rhizina undulata]
MATRTRYKSPSPSASSPSPATSSGTMTLDHPPPATLPHPPESLSASTFHQQYPSSYDHYHGNGTQAGSRKDFVNYRMGSGRRDGELPILNYHNAVPQSAGVGGVGGQSRNKLPAPVNVVLPSVQEVEARGHVLGSPPLGHPPGSSSSSSLGPTVYGYGGGNAHGNGNGNEVTFGYYSTQRFQQAEAEKPRSLSIQSLISSPGTTPGGCGETGGGGRKRKGSEGRYEDGVMLGMESRQGTRSGSVVSNCTVNIDDPDVRDAVEALGGLKADFAPTSPKHLPPPPNLQSQPPKQEPFLNLLTSSAHPLLSSAITTSLSAYDASKSYSPSFRYAAESVENRVGVPVGNVVSAVGRRTGLESVLRRGLTGRRGSEVAEEPRDGSKKRKTSRDEEECESMRPEHQQQGEGQLITTQESGDVATLQNNWQTRLMLSTSGLGVALSEDSLIKLKYCLEWLRAANVHLGRVIQALKTVVVDWENHQRQQQQSRMEEGRCGESKRGYIPESCEQQRQALVGRIEGLKKEVLTTMKSVVDVVSKYTGGALPEHARALVKRHMYALPRRWQAATATPASSTSSASNNPNPKSLPTSPNSAAPPRTSTTPSSELVPAHAEEDANSPVGTANRMLVLAKEGLDMMSQVSAVVEGTIVRAEEWCERLGRRKRGEEAGEGWERKDGEGDVEMGGQQQGQRG